MRRVCDDRSTRCAVKSNITVDKVTFSASDRIPHTATSNSHVYNVLLFCSCTCSQWHYIPTHCYYKYTYIFRSPYCALIIWMCEKLHSTHDATDSTTAIEMLEVSRFMTTFIHHVDGSLSIHATNFIRVLNISSTAWTSRNSHSISALLLLL